MRTTQIECSSTAETHHHHHHHIIIIIIIIICRFGNESSPRQRTTLMARQKRRKKTLLTPELYARPSNEATETLNLLPRMLYHRAKQLKRWKTSQSA
jgi:hypothetical protein